MMILKSIPYFLYCLMLPIITKRDHDTAFGNSQKEYQVYSGTRKLINFDPIPLNFFKELKDKAGATVNDVAMAALSQAIHDYCVHCDCEVLKEKGIKTRCSTTMTVALPRHQEDKFLAIGNQWVPISMNLGLGYETIMQRLQHLQKEREFLKNSPLPYCQLLTQNQIIPALRLNFNFTRKQTHDVVTRHTLNWTNVPGPKEEAILCGKLCKNVQFFLNHIMPVVSMLSYNGQVNISMTIDDEDNKDIHLFPQFYSRALVLLAREVNAEIPSSVLKIANLP